MRIVGVDIIRGSPHARFKSKYAVYYIDDSEEWSKSVSRGRLFRFVKEKKPDFIAVDNISEIFKDRTELVEFLRFLPADTKLIQTAGKSSLPSLAKRYGISIDPKNPFDEAKASALLVKYGVGEVVSVFSDKTVIKVSRNRSLGKGGWRQNKYRRKVHDSVRAVFREIKRVLDECGFDYTEEMRTAYGGISRGIFVVNEPRERIPVNSFRTRDVQVTVSAVVKDKIEFLPIGRQKTYTIVGIDPGNTVGVAVLDLSGNLLGIGSKKEWSSSSVSEFILSFGKPILIATDKKNPPDYILKMKASFNCILHTPKEDIPVEKKKALASKFSVKNDHERDALASALDAFNTFRNKLRNVEKRVPEGYDIDEIKAGIIRGQSLKLMLEKREEIQEKSEKEEFLVPKDEVKKRDRIIAKLRSENRELEKKISELRKEIERLKEKVYNISSEEHRKIREQNVFKALQSEIRDLRIAINEKDRMIEELRGRIEMLKRMKYLEFRGWRSVKVLRKFTKDEIERLENSAGLNRGDILYIRNVAGGGKIGAEMLVRKGVRAIIASGEMSHLAMEVFERESIPVIPQDRIRIKMFEEFALVRSEELEEILAETEKSLEKRKLERIEEIISEYRTRRREEIG